MHWFWKRIARLTSQEKWGKPKRQKTQKKRNDQNFCCFPRQRNNRIDRRSRYIYVCDAHVSNMIRIFTVSWRISHPFLSWCHVWASRWNLAHWFDIHEKTGRYLDDQTIAQFQQACAACHCWAMLLGLMFPWAKLFLACPFGSYPESSAFNLKREIFEQA